MRDDFATFMNGPKSGALAIQKLREFHKNMAQRTAIFFRDLLGDESINCALRIAEDVNGVESYVTKARSDRLDNVSREKGSVPLPADKGLAAVLLSNERLGVLVIRDIEAATSAGSWMPTPNDKLPDVKTLMVAPVNGWEASAKVMIGILYVTSQKDRFCAPHTVPLKAVADLLGMVYPIMFKRIGTALKKGGPGDKRS
jgi:hypothetical protein